MPTSEHIRTTASPAGSSRKALFELQVEQHHHDEAYHREIARLPLHHRLNHMALHFAKYVGKIAAANDEEALQAVYTDVLIIGLSVANILNIELWDFLDHKDRDFPGLLPFGRDLANHLEQVLKDRQKLLRETAMAAGRIAAACEKIDHLEDVSFRAEIIGGIRQLATLSIAFLAEHGADPSDAVRNRLSGVKQRSKLHGRI
jgi:hypothetical protein